jgi:copper chaperone
MHLTIIQQWRNTMATVSIKGMSCPHCVASTKTALESIEGIFNVAVSLEKNEASYTGDVPLATIKEAIVKIGFEIVE